MVVVRCGDENGVDLLAHLVEQLAVVVERLWQRFVGVLLLVELLDTSQATINGALGRIADRHQVLLD